MVSSSEPELAQVKLVTEQAKLAFSDLPDSHGA